VISADQCRAARAFLDWTRDVLATRSLVSVAAIADFETRRREPQVRTVIALEQALESGGVRFRDNGDGPGVHLPPSDVQETGNAA